MYIYIYVCVYIYILLSIITSRGNHPNYLATAVSYSGVDVASRFEAGEKQKLIAYPCLLVYHHDYIMLVITTIFHIV